MSGIGSTSSSSGWSFIGSKVDDPLVAGTPVEPGVIRRIGLPVISEAGAVTEHEQGGRLVADEPCSPLLTGEEVQPEQHPDLGRERHRFDAELEGEAVRRVRDDHGHLSGGFEEVVSAVQVGPVALDVVLPHGVNESSVSAGRLPVMRRLVQMRQ